MLKIVLFAILLISPFKSLSSLEKSCTFDQTSEGFLNLESNPEQELQIESYTLKNTSDQPLYKLSLSINTNREEQKQQMVEKLLEKNNLWQWWKDQQLTLEKEGFYSFDLGSTLKLPSREVPLHNGSLYEYYFDNKWQLIDGEQDLIYLAFDNHTRVNYEDVADEPFLALRTKTTRLEEPYRFDKACSNFAQMDLFPQEFDCLAPSENYFQVFWQDHTLDLYPEESLKVQADGTVTQTVVLKNRIVQSGTLQVESFFPIVQVINQSTQAITIEKENCLLEPNQSYDLTNSVFKLSVHVEDPTGTLVLVGKGGSISNWKIGQNKINLCYPKEPIGAFLVMHYELLQNSTKIKPPRIVNNDHHFDHVIPSFSLEVGTTPEKIWWQISSDKNYDCLIPNFQGIQDYTAKLELDACTDTFFNPQEEYFFRVKSLIQEKWTDWSPAFAFVVNKPEQIKNPEFKKINEKQYQISWDPVQDKDTHFLIFASNSFDFMPSIYVNQQYNLIENNEVVAEAVDNLVGVTTENSIKIGSEYAFYRIVAERQGKYSIPSPIIRVYDYGLSIPRNVLQASTRRASVERVSFPIAYPEFQENLEFQSHALSLGRLDKEYYKMHEFVEPIVWNYLLPLFLPENHPVKPKLDRLFSKRVTQTGETLRKAGFTNPKPMKFSKTYVTKHKDIHGIMFKFFCDDQKGISDWQECYYRVSGALSIQEALNRYNINHVFVVPTKWIYPLPGNPSPPGNLERKNFIVVETALDIYTGKQNNDMWKSPVINRHNLLLLYVLLSELGLNDSVYSFNIPITKDNRIAFIDTEHHHKWPVPFYKLWAFLSSDMKDYWTRVWETGGNP